MPKEIDKYCNPQKGFTALESAQVMSKKFKSKDLCLPSARSFNSLVISYSNKYWQIMKKKYFFTINLKRQKTISKL